MNDMPIKIETGPYEHNADGIWGTSSVWIKRDVYSSLLTTELSVSAGSAAVIGIVGETCRQCQKDGLVCEDVMKKFMELSDTDLDYELARTTAAQNSALQEFANIAHDLTRLGTTLSMLEKAQQIRNYRMPDVGLTGWVDETVGKVQGDMCMDMSIANDCFLFRIMIRENNYVRCAGKDVTVWDVTYTLSQDMTMFHNTWSPDAGKFHLLESPTKPAIYFTKADAFDYAQRRMDSMEKTYFYDENPVIPEKYAENFKLFGIPLPGYRFA